MTTRLSASVGCELQPVMIPVLPELRREKLVSHLQITIPNTLTYFQAREAALDTPLIAHCNLLNTFGENSWAELKPWTKQIRSLKPVHVVEHFTAFRLSSGHKPAVWFDLELMRPLKKQAVIDTVDRWQTELGVPLCLENVPLADNVEAYFDLLLDVKSATGCEIACDLPHFFLSVFSANYSDAQIRNLAAALAPRQLHVGGLSRSSDGLLRDNHKVFSPWILSEGLALFPEAPFVTLEQNHRIPAESVSKQLRMIHDCEPAKTPEGYRQLHGASSEVLSQEIAFETARSNRYPIPPRDESRYRQLSAERYTKESSSLIDFYDKFLPFVSPLSVLEAEVDNLPPTEIVRTLAAASQWAISYLSWRSPQEVARAYAVVRYGEGDKICFERRMGSSVGEYSKFEETRRFSSERGFWVEVTSPRLRIDERDGSELIYDRAAI